MVNRCHCRSPGYQVSILVTQETLGLAEGYVIVQPLGRRPVKGLEAPVQVYELTGASTTRSRLQAAAGRGLTRFVGRDGELQQLHRALEAAASGQGQLVAIVGEPGVGKSRLLWEFTHSRHTQGWLTIEARSVSYGRATSYLPVIELLREYFRIDAHDDARTVREKVTGKARILVAVNYRPEYRHGWSGKSYYRLLRIDPLREASATELLPSLLGSDPSLEALNVSALVADKTQAEARFAETLSLSSMLGMRPLVAPCHLGLGKLYRRTGKRSEADEHFATATSMYREMGMTYWLEKLEHDMAALK